MAETLVELQAQLTSVNTAITKLRSGEQVLEFEIGSGQSKRRYQFSGVSLQNLRAEKARIIAAIDLLTASEIRFRETSRMATTWRKI